MRIPRGLLMKVADTVREPRNYRHLAIVFKNGNVLAMATNESRHAEVAALSKLDCTKRSGTTVFSVRVRKNGTLAMGKPCDACMVFMREHGVKNVAWTDSNGVITTERVYLFPG